MKKEKTQVKSITCYLEQRNPRRFSTIVV